MVAKVVVPLVVAVLVDVRQASVTTRELARFRLVIPNRDPLPFIHTSSRLPIRRCCSRPSRWTRCRLIAEHSRIKRNSATAAFADKKVAGRFVISCRLFCCAGRFLVAASMNSETFADRRGLCGFARVLTPDEGSVSVLLLKQFDPEEEFCDTLHS